MTQNNRFTSLFGTSNPVEEKMDIAGFSDVRWEKVARLKAAIENGTYNVSSQAVADKLISSMLGRD